MGFEKLINEIINNQISLDVNQIKNFLDKAYELANSRSLSNLIKNFGFQADKFFPKTSKKKFDYYDMMFAIPKAYENRYAKLWISLFPARVNYLIKIINENLMAIAGNIETINQYISANPSLTKELKSFASIKNQNDLNKIDNALILADFFKNLYKILKEFRKDVKGDIVFKKQMDELLNALEELKENYLYGPIDKIFIQTIAFNFPERSSIFVSTNETIPYIQFWGSNVFSVRINGIMPNAINIDGKNIMIKEWFAKIRGTQLAKNYCALFLDFEDNILTLYPVDFSFAQSVNETGFIGFSIAGYLTRLSYSPLNTAITDDLNKISRGSNNEKYEYFIKPKIEENEQQQNTRRANISDIIEI